MKKIILTTLCLLLMSSTVMAERYYRRGHGRHYGSHHGSHVTVSGGHRTHHGGYYYCYVCNISHPHGYVHRSVRHRAPHQHHTQSVERAIISEQIEIVE